MRKLLLFFALSAAFYSPALPLPVELLLKVREAVVHEGATPDAGASLALGQDADVTDSLA